MDKVYWLSFYEDGAFSSYIGNPHQTREDAVGAMWVMFFNMKRLFRATMGSDGFVYDRYGTICAIKVEEGEECS